MIIDFRRTAGASDFDTDICIVGSGAAGLSLAHELAGSFRVLVVEAGGRRTPRGIDDFLVGEAVDLAFDGFANGRRRVFGGATKAWFGQCIRLDPIDFEKRDWVPYSGWPVTASALAPYYDRAEQKVLSQTPFYDERIWQELGRPDPGFDHVEVTPAFTAYTPQTDFTKLFGRRLFRDHDSLKILLNAAAVRIDLDPGGQSVAGLQIRGDSSRQGRIRARAFVLCGGGIENPRLMLASNDVQSSGVGNGRDLVGRFFQDHPSALTGMVATDRPYPLQDQFRMLRHRGLKFWPKLAFTDAAQRRGQYLNANALLFYRYSETSPAPRVKALLAALQSRSPAAIMTQGMRLIRNLPELAVRGFHTASTGLAPVFKPTGVMLKAYVEQVPDPECRVTLADARDRFGVPRARLSWRLHEDELRTMRGITEAAGRELERLGFGEMKAACWLDRGVERARGEIEDNYHHAGTTRMATTPAEGVVDPTCRVFGISNLYIAGSSVFPTSGYANPTLTIVALAIRLADELRRAIPAAGQAKASSGHRL